MDISTAGVGGDPTSILSTLQASTAISTALQAQTDAAAGAQAAELLGSIGLGNSTDVSA